MPTQNQIVQQMVQGLAVTLPTLDTTIGSPVRQILDVCAEELAELTADQYLLTYQYDINNMSGANLDAFCALFGITRFAAKRAVGFVTLSRQTTSTSDVTFGAGSQVGTIGSPPIIFSTIYPVTLVASGTSVTVAVQAVVSGTSGNVSGGTITNAVLSGAFSSISSVTNTDATSGGADPESDDQLIARFKATVFRQLTGTAPMFLATALNDPNVTLGNVIGATETFNEQIALSSGTGVSSVTDLAYFYPDTAYLGVDLSLGDIFSPGVQYTIVSNFVATPAAPLGAVTTGGSGAKTYVQTTANLASSYEAVYWPWIKRLDQNSVLSTFPPSPFIQGIIARTHANKNIGQAPAGTAYGQVQGAVSLEYNIQEQSAEYNDMYPAGVNAILNFPGDGICVFGSRTLDPTGEFGQISVQTVFNINKRIVKQQTRFVNFENNNPATRAQVVRALTSLFREQRKAGILQGTKDSEAFFIICDDSNNGPTVIASGKLVCRIGLAVSRPVEFQDYTFEQDTRAIDAALAAAQ